MRWRDRLQSRSDQSGCVFRELQDNAWLVPEEFQSNAYPFSIHVVGRCDEYPHLNSKYRGELPYHGRLAAGMVSV